MKFRIDPLQTKPYIRDDVRVIKLALKRKRDAKSERHKVKAEMKRIILEELYE